MIPRAFLQTLTLAGLAAVAVGCASSAASDARPLEQVGPYQPYEGDAADAGISDDAPVVVGTARPLQGSPLCNASPSTCSPDEEDGGSAQSCGLAPDGSPSGGSINYDNTTFACHVQAAASPDAAVGPACEQAGASGAGMACRRPTDCAAGYECIGAGTCRHYCCSGNVECKSDEFCDIQVIASSAARQVPVCMPVHPCGLIDAGGCPSTETCAVVRENGETSCVALGTAMAGQRCETDHCARGLVCLGTPGERTCFRVCTTTTASTQSASTQCTGMPTPTCKGGLPLFVDPSVGICQ